MCVGYSSIKLHVHKPHMACLAQIHVCTDDKKSKCYENQCSQLFMDYIIRVHVNQQRSCNVRTCTYTYHQANISSMAHFGNSQSTLDWQAHSAGTAQLKFRHARVHLQPSRLDFYDEDWQLPYPIAQSLTLLCTGRVWLLTVEARCPSNASKRLRSRQSAVHWSRLNLPQPTPDWIASTSSTNTAFSMRIFLLWISFLPPTILPTTCTTPASLPRVQFKARQHCSE